MTDNVNNPKHYEKNSVTIRPIDLIRYLPGSLANACKYIIRAGDKNNELEDIKKAIWYLNDILNDDNSNELFVVPYVEANSLNEIKFSLANFYYTHTSKYLNRLFCKRSKEGIKDTIEMLKADYDIKD